MVSDTERGEIEVEILQFFEEEMIRPHLEKD